MKDAQGKISILSKQAQPSVKSNKWYNKNKIVLSIAKLLKSDNNQPVEAVEYFDVFVRPHDVEISKKASGDEYIAANITHINLAGPVVKLELESPDYELIQAELPHESFEKLSLKKGDLVYAKARQFTMFEV